jgi:hypothetical protein
MFPEPIKTFPDNIPVLGVAGFLSYMIVTNGHIINRNGVRRYGYALTAEWVLNCFWLITDKAIKRQFSFSHIFVLQDKVAAVA